MQFGVVHAHAPSCAFRIQTLAKQAIGAHAACARRGVRVHYPELHLCTDNGAMIAMAAAMRLQSGLAEASERYAFDVKPRWPMASLMTPETPSRVPA